MRGGKMEAVRRQTLTILLRELKTPHITWRLGDDYRLHIAVYNEHEADEFRKLLFIKIGFSRVREKVNVTAHCHLIEVTWNDQERETLIKNIERYLQEDNMGPTNINRENTKFYAIVEDAEGKKTAYEITHSSLTSRMECCFGESSVTHTVEFDQDYMRKCDCVFTEWVKNKDELEKLRAENEQLRKDKDECEIKNLNLNQRLGKCEDQLRKACEFLNGYGDVHIHIPTEMEKLDYFSRIVNYETNGETNRREFGKKVAEQVKRRASYYGVWREPGNAETMVEDNKILEDAVESAMNSFYISSDYVKADRIYVQNPAFDASAIRKSIQLSLNSWYGLTSAAYSNGICLNATKTKPTPIFNAYDSIKDVKFANPATIVFWKDGTKTVVKAQGDEEYVPEVGLAMCICKKVMGNTRDYYRVFKHWMKKV